MSRLYICHLVYLTYMQSMSCEMPGWMKHKLESRLLGEIRVQSLGWKDLLKKEMAIHSSTIAWKIPWTEEPSRLQSMGLQRVGQDLNKQGDNIQP